MGRLHRAFIATSVYVFFIGTAVAVALPHRMPQLQLVPSGASRDLIIPVDGVAPAALTDTWGAARSEGRKHEGIDIMAGAGTPVVTSAVVGSRVGTGVPAWRKFRTPLAITMTASATKKPPPAQRIV